MSIDRLDALFSDPAQLARIRGEAEFGFREVGGLVGALPAGARVLDVGCGTGYLLARLAAMYPGLEFTGIEPIGVGFSQFSEPLDLIGAATPNVTIHRAPIESFRRPEGHDGFDLIYSVNVFEHLEDWRMGLDRCMDLLSRDGSVVILCPNYSVPYESHFGLPIIGTADFTRRIFDARIREAERRENSVGLWDSLNFITVPALARYARTKGYRIEFDRGIMARMLDRLDDDPQFAARKSGLAPVAGFLNRLGAGRAMGVLPAAVSPYLKASVRAA